MFSRSELGEFRFLHSVAQLRPVEVHLKMKTEGSYESAANIYQTTLRHILEGSNFHSHHTSLFA
jgi:hypothetical protein